jgi:hypothetical protein
MTRAGRAAWLLPAHSGAAAREALSAGNQALGNGAAAVSLALTLVISALRCDVM